jgi:hypothetical protein
MALPPSVLSKLERTNVHLQALNSELQSYYALNPAKSVPHPDSTPEHRSFQIEVLIPIPDAVKLIAGDALQNLRSALDYLVWELVVTAGNSPKKQSFPVCTTDGGFKKAVENGRLRGVIPDARKLISDLQPCRIDDFRTHNLYVLDELANMNKHRHLLVATIAGMSAENLSPTVIDGRTQFTGLAKAKQGAKIRPLIGWVDGKPQAQFAAFIALKEGTAEGEEIVHTLRTLYRWVANTCLPQFERFFD